MLDTKLDISGNVDKEVILFVGQGQFSNSRSPISGNKTIGIRRKHCTKHYVCLLCLCVCECVYVFTHSRLDFSAGWHESVCLLHYTAGEVANASLLLSVIRVLYLKIDDIDKSS